jgi:hypothetical protein
MAIFASKVLGPDETFRTATRHKGLSTNYVTLREEVRRVGYAQVTKNRYLYATALEGGRFGQFRGYAQVTGGGRGKKRRKIGLRNLWTAPNGDGDPRSPTGINHPRLLVFPYPPLSIFPRRDALSFKNHAHIL